MNRSRKEGDATCPQASGTAKGHTSNAAPKVQSSGVAKYRGIIKGKIEGNQPARAAGEQHKYDADGICEACGQDRECRPVDIRTVIAGAAGENICPKHLQDYVSCGCEKPDAAGEQHSEDWNYIDGVPMPNQQEWTRVLQNSGLTYEQQLLIGNAHNAAIAAERELRLSDSKADQSKITTLFDLSEQLRAQLATAVEGLRRINQGENAFAVSSAALAKIEEGK